MTSSASSETSSTSASSLALPNEAVLDVSKFMVSTTIGLPYIDDRRIKLYRSFNRDSRTNWQEPVTGKHFNDKLAEVTSPKRINPRGGGAHNATSCAHGCTWERRRSIGDANDRTTQ